METRFTNGFEAAPRSRLVFAFHTPAMLAAWIADAVSTGDASAEASMHPLGAKSLRGGLGASAEASKVAEAAPEYVRRGPSFLTRMQRMPRVSKERDVVERGDLWTSALGRTRAELAAVQESSNLPNRDGDGSKPIRSEVLELAEGVATRLLRLLPDDIPLPDVFPEADGEICLNWSTEEGRVFSVSMGEHGNANYAGEFGKEGEVHGWRPLLERGVVLDEAVRELAQHVTRLHRKHASAEAH